MCGIFAGLFFGDPILLDDFVDTLEPIKRRGPDHFETVIVPDKNILFAASVLHLRGNQIQKQPVYLKDNSVLLWNGEMYSHPYIEDSLLFEHSDTKLLADLLQDASHDQNSILDIFFKIKGEFAFVFWSGPLGKLFYGRDLFGRRSLLSSSQKYFFLSSIKLNMAEWSEVECGKIYVHDALTLKQSIPWPLEISNSIFSISTTSPIWTNIEQNAIIDKFISLFSLAISRRTYNLDQVCILFSGGLDCSLIVRICDSVMKKDSNIHLINIAFENKNFLKNLSKHEDKFLVPDRISGSISFEQLKQVCQRVNLIFEPVNVSASELTVLDDIVDCIYPSTSQMDFSIGAPFWYCARRCSQIAKSSKILLTGVGADEQFAGYSRHLSKFQNFGITKLLEELEMDLRRIGSRNMGRDDRCISHFGVEARYPYLDEDLVSFCSSLPIDVKCNLDMPRGTGDKMLLRRIAKQLGGLDYCSQLPKRAIQFGCKTAKLFDTASKGTDQFRV